MRSRREKMRPWWLKTDFFSLATNPVLSPEFMMDAILLFVAHLQLVMINVPSASKLAPSMGLIAPGRCFRDLCDSAGCDPNSFARWTPLVVVA